MISQETFTLANGVAIPKLGFGTWRIEDDAVTGLVRHAVAAGYRHIDTAQAYGNERGVGKGLRASGVSRNDLFVTTKLAADCKSFAEARRLIDASLAALDVGPIDLMLIHSPQPWEEFGSAERYFAGNMEAWRALEDAYGAGKLRAIGVSNFGAADVDNILEGASVKPVVNQVLAHVGNTPFSLIEACQNRGILVEAYSPVAHGSVLGNPELVAMANRYSVSVAQLCIRYCLQLGLLPLPKSSHPDHLRSNASVEFQIADEDMAVLRAVPVPNYGEAAHLPVFARGK